MEKIKNRIDFLTNKLNKFRRDKLGFIFQDFNLLDTLTGYENISLSLYHIYTNANKI